MILATKDALGALFDRLAEHAKRDGCLGVIEARRAHDLMTERLENAAVPQWGRRDLDYAAHPAPP